MPNNPLFSTYHGGENRVTSSTLAVFERIDLALVRDILAAATGSGDDLRAVTFENQVTTDGHAIPDAKISGRFTWWFETKILPDAYSGPGHARTQLREHSLMLEKDHEAILFVLTPDPVRPAWFDDFPDEGGSGRAVSENAARRVWWLSFRQLATAIDEVTSDATRLLGDRTRFLLAELVALYEVEGLLTSDDTVIVAARKAWPEYQESHVYICQPNRTFRTGLSHLGFYAEGAIQPLVPAIRHHAVAVPFTYEETERLLRAGQTELARCVRAALDAGTRTEGASYDVILLSAPDDSETLHLAYPVANDTTTASGKPWAWTLSQRYTNALRLASGVTHTSDL